MRSTQKIIIRLPHTRSATQVAQKKRKKKKEGKAHPTPAVRHHVGFVPIENSEQWTNKEERKKQIKDVVSCFLKNARHTVLAQ
jgi:hypothetical protein